MAAGRKEWPRIPFSDVLKGDVSMEFRIEKRGAIAITGIARTVSFKDGANMREIPRFWQECHDAGLVRKLAATVPPGSRMGVMGVCVNDMDDAKQTFTYVIGIESPEAAARRTLPPGCVEVTAEPGTWAVFPSRGPMPDAIQAVWKRVYSEWFPTAGYERAKNCDIEVYSDGDMAAADYYCEVWLPVKKG
jgi:AraC family transcriptional regulator